MKSKKDRYIGSTVVFHGIECSVNWKLDNCHYRLIAIGGTAEELQKDKSFTEYQMWGAVAVPVTCPRCGKTTWFDDTGIPEGIKYEVPCDNCDMMMSRKK